MTRALALAALAFAVCFALAVWGVAHLARAEIGRAREREVGDGVRDARDGDGAVVRRDGRDGGGARARRRRHRGAGAEDGEDAAGADGGGEADDAPVRGMSRKEQRLEMYRQRWEAREAAEREEMELAARSGGSRRARAEDAEDAEPEVSDETLIAALDANRISRFDQLAKRFGFKKLDTVLARVREIEAAGLVSGVVDETRFVRVSRDELESIASYVLERGRVDVEELTQKSNQILAL